MNFLKKFYTEQKLIFHVVVTVLAGAIIYFTASWHNFLFWFPAFISLYATAVGVVEAYSVSVKTLDPLGQKIKGYLYEIDKYIVFLFTIPFIATFLDKTSFPDVYVYIQENFESIWKSGFHVFAGLKALWFLVRGGENNAVADTLRVIKADKLTEDSIVTFATKVK
jgi:hypothetical protein